MVTVTVVRRHHKDHVLLSLSTFLQSFILTQCPHGKSCVLLPHNKQLSVCPTGLWGSDGLSLSLGRALYNSTDSLDSAKAVTIAMEAAAMAMAGKRHPSTDSHSSVMTCDKAVLVSKAEEYLKTPRSSIGIQVKFDSEFLVLSL